MSEHIFTGSANDIKIPLKVVIARLGFKGMEKIPNEFEVLFERAERILRESAKPCAISKDFPVEESTGNILKLRDLTLTGNFVRKFLRDSTLITFILATIGHEVDEEIEKAHRTGDELLSYFIDGMASELVEYWVRYVDGILRREKRNMVGSMRISPGYGDIDMRLNQWIVKNLDGSRIGVDVIEDSWILVPRKSISAMIGWKKS